MTKEIPLSKGKVSLVDDEDFEFLLSFSWCLGGEGYAVSRCKNSLLSTYQRRKLIMHRLLMGVTNVTGIQVDHINGDKLDNRKENLRLVSNQENAMNVHVKKREKHSSKYIGVCYNTSGLRKKRWNASIGFNGKKIFIGNYMTEEEAALAYNKKAEELGFLTRSGVDK
jgi:hypothetical protein